MAQRDNHIYADYGELMECLLTKRAQFASDETFEIYALASVRRFLKDLQHLGIDIPMSAPLSHLLSAPSTQNKLGN